MALQGFGRAPLDWYEQPDAHDQIADLIDWMLDNGEITGLDEARYVMRKPWKYSTDRNQMLSEQRQAA